jgi:peptidoglycan/xylan/chitin deacetylase (PgdA/CDA1 family)
MRHRPLANRSRDAAFFCYHSIHDDGPRWLTVAPSLFEQQLATLRREGWRTGAEADLEALARGASTGGPTAFLTFDDGYVDNYTTAFPLLREQDMTAIFFLLPSHLDGGAFEWPEVAADQRRHPDVMRSLTWAQVEEMAAAGMSFGSHSLTHSHLPQLGDEELRQELLDSRRAIAERLGDCTTLAYPFGHWDGRVAAAAKAAGYSFAFTLPRAHQGETTPWTIPRISVDFRDEGRRFGIKLRPLARRLYLSRAKAMLRRGE